MTGWRRPVLGLTIGLMVAKGAMAGVLLSSSLGWSVFAFRPTKEEPTPNYWAVSPGLSGGYSYRQIIDAALFINYIPGTLKVAQIGKEDAQLMFLGLEVAIRLKRKIFLGLRFGQGQYRLINHLSELDTKGLWKGRAGGFMVGAMHRSAKESFWQLSMVLHHTLLARQNSDELDPVEQPLRRIDAFSLALSYTFSGFSGRGESSMFGKFF